MEITDPQADPRTERLVAEFIKRSDKQGQVAAGYLKQYFNTPDKYVQLVTALQAREVLLLGVLTLFSETLGSAVDDTTYEQASFILMNILQRIQGKKPAPFNETFEALAKIAVISFRPGVDKLDSALARWVDGPRGAEFHLFHGDLTRLVPYGIGFIPPVLTHWMEARPEVLEQSAAMRVLGPNLIAILVNCGVLCHELDDSIEDDDGSLQDRICQIMSLEPPQFNVWDLVAVRTVIWVPQESTFIKMDVWRLSDGFDLRSNVDLYYWENGGFKRVVYKLVPVPAVNDVEPPGTYVSGGEIGVPDYAECLYAVSRMTRDNTRVSYAGSS